MADDDLKTQVRALRLEPGDVVIVEVEDRITQVELERLKERVYSVLGPAVADHQVVVIGGGAHVGILRLAEVDDD